MRGGTSAIERIMSWRFAQDHLSQRIAFALKLTTALWGMGQRPMFTLPRATYPMAR